MEDSDSEEFLMDTSGAEQLDDSDTDRSSGRLEETILSDEETEGKSSHSDTSEHLDDSDSNQSSEKPDDTILLSDEDTEGKDSHSDAPGSEQFNDSDSAQSSEKMEDTLLSDDVTEEKGSTEDEPLEKYKSSPSSYEPDSESESSDSPATPPRRRCRKNIKYCEEEETEKNEETPYQKRKKRLISLGLWEEFKAMESIRHKIRWRLMSPQQKAKHNAQARQRMRKQRERKANMRTLRSAGGKGPNDHKRKYWREKKAQSRLRKKLSSVSSKNHFVSIIYYLIYIIGSHFEF